MNFFFDSSSLFKLYHQENGSAHLIELLGSISNITIFISEVALVEIHSAVYKRIRIGDLTHDSAAEFLEIFNNDLEKYTVIKINSSTIKQAQHLLTKYGVKGLRTLDSFQLASVLKIKTIIDLSITHDNLLKDIMNAEGFETQF